MASPPAAPPPPSSLPPDLGRERAPAALQMAPPPDYKSRNLGLHPPPILSPMGNDDTAAAAAAGAVHDTQPGRYRLRPYPRAAGPGAHIHNAESERRRRGWRGGERLREFGQRELGGGRELEAEAGADAEHPVVVGEEGEGEEEDAEEDGDEEDGEGSDCRDDAFDAMGEGLDPVEFDNDEAYARALQEVEVSGLAARLMALAD